MTEATINTRPLRDAFREAVLALGGVFASHRVDDGLISTIARALGRVIDRHISKAAGRYPSMDHKPGSRLRPHPAIIELLASIGASVPEGAPAADAQREWLRLPGLFRRWEFEQVIDVDEEFLFEEAGRDAHGTTLFAIYSRPRAEEEESTP